jgi:molybdopterin-binding protein
VIYRPGEKKKTKQMSYLGVGTTPLKRGVKPPQSAFSRLFQSPSESDGFRSPSGSDEKRRQRPSGFDGQDCRDSERVFEDTADGIVVVNSISIAAAKEIELSNAFLDLLSQVGEKDPDWRTGYPRIPVCGIQAGSTDTTAEAVNGVFEDTADGIVALSSISIAAAKEMELSFKLSAATGSTATPAH